MEIAMDMMMVRNQHISNRKQKKEQTKRKGLPNTCKSKEGRYNSHEAVQQTGQQ